MKFARIGAVALLCLSLGACDHLNRTQQRALTGGAIGTVGGIAAAAIVGAPLAAGAAIGGLGGAAIGAVTTPDKK